MVSMGPDRTGTSRPPSSASQGSHRSAGGPTEEEISALDKCNSDLEIRETLQAEKVRGALDRGYGDIRLTEFDHTTMELSSEPPTPARKTAGDPSPPYPGSSFTAHSLLCDRGRGQSEDPEANLE